MRADSDMVTVEAETEEVEGSWVCMNPEVSIIGQRKPAARAIGSKIVKMNRGIAGRVEVIFVVAEIRTMAY